MSFFIKKNKSNNKRQHTKITSKINKKSKKEKYNEEIDSDFEEDLNEKNDFIEEDDEIEETAQEKLLRLAKIQLEEGAKSYDKETLARRLEDDHLEQTGKLKKLIADSFSSYDPQTAEKIFRCKYHKLSITCLVISSDDTAIYTGSKDGGLVKWSLQNKSKELVLKNHTTDMKLKKHPATILALAISSDNKFLACGLNNNNIIILCPNTFNHIHTFKGHKGNVTGIVFRRSSHDLYSCSADKTIKIWNVTEKSYIETLFGHQLGITSIDALNRERAISTGGRDNTVRIWKIIEESQLIFNGLGTSSIDIVRLINEENFISGDDEGNLCLWSSFKKKPIFTVQNSHGLSPINNTPYWITSIATIINTDIIATGSFNGYIKIWKCVDYKSLTLLFDIEVKGFINHLVFTKDGNYLIAGIGQEHKSGRWWSDKESKNGIFIIRLIKHKEV